MSDNLTNQELCILLESIRALLQTGNSERAEEIITNAIQRIDKTQTVNVLYFSFDFSTSSTITVLIN